MPDQSEAPRHRTDLNPGEISFFDPRAQANMNAVRGDGQFDPEYRRLPRPGELFVWPSFLYHLVHPNLMDEPRISVSFNAVLRRKVLFGSDYPVLNPDRWIASFAELPNGELLLLTFDGRLYELAE